ncbi:MAG: SLC13 family permease [Planctomycetota bacterium]
MSWQAVFTLVVTLLTLVSLARDLLAPANTLLLAAVLLLLGGVLTPEETFAGFGNPAPITVAALYVLARGAEKTGVIQPLLLRLLGRGGGGRLAMTRLLVPSAAASAFLNNTPIVAMLIPQVLRWADQVKDSASRYLMPLSFAVVLGGVITTMGTSTNLVVSGMLQKSGAEPLGLFEITPIGLPVALVGLLVLIVTGPWLQPIRRAAAPSRDDNVRRFAVAMRVVPGGPLDGRTVEQADLRNLQGVYLVSIERDGELIAPVGPHTPLRGGDHLNFAGTASTVVDLQSRRGLESSEVEHLRHFDSARHQFQQAVVGANSPLVGRTLRDVEFRSRYQAAVVAIHRAGQPIDKKLGDVRLRLGDSLIVLADPGFWQRWRDRSDFLMVAPMEGTPPAVSKKAWIAGVILVAVCGVAGLGLLPMMQAALVGAIALVAFGVLTASEARSAVDLDTVIVIAAAFALGTAMEKTGLAEALATGVSHLTGDRGVHGTLLGLAIATVLTTEMITNNAAAALMMPIAMASAHQLGVDPRPFAITIGIAASNSFLTPIGYQTNVMVYGPGGYRFTDYVRAGFPLTIASIATTVLLVPWWFGI